MIDAVVSEHVNAPADRVGALYDPDNWARLFPATIRGARVSFARKGTRPWSRLITSRAGS